MHVVVSIVIFETSSRIVNAGIAYRTIEALARAGEYEKGFLSRAVAMFEVRRSDKYVVQSY